MNLVILDACRNNPFARSFRSSSRGLAQVVAPTGSFISYATGPGNVAADGEGDNGFFTEKLLEHMMTPGLKLEEVFKRVRSDVQQDSNSKQVPWDSSSVTGDFFFVPAEGVATAKAKVVVPSTSSDQDFAAQAWEVIKDSKDPELLEEFIKLFPEAPQRNLARLKLMAMASSSSTEALAEVASTSSKEQVPTASSVNSEVLSGEAAKKKLLETRKCGECDLRGAWLYRANLTNANLRYANLMGANLRGARFCRTTMPDGTINSDDC